MAESLPSQCKTLRSNPSTTKKKKIVYSVPMPIYYLGYLLFLLFNFLSSLYILAINSLSDYLAKIFSYS
jgi:hypothetical protein